MTQITLGSLFDGSGGFPLAAVHAGIRPVWASEIEPFPIRVTHARFPDLIHLGDIRSINGADIPPVDIITGGSPCVDLSISGQRAGLKGERSGLFFEMIRVIREMREATGGASPQWVVFENVPGALSSSKGADFEQIILSYASLAGETIECPRPQKWSNAGCVLADSFGLSWRILDARYWGVAQMRRRVFLVAYFGRYGGVDMLRRYSLSAKACLGILRRAKERRKEIPPILLEVLIRQSQKEKADI